MKQFVGLYAVGEGAVPEVLTGVYLHSLYSTPEFRVAPTLVMPLLPDTKGLYIGIITQGQTREVKVIPFLESNNRLIEQTLTEEVSLQCMNTISSLLAGQPEESADGEATRAYVFQG